MHWPIFPHRGNDKVFATIISSTMDALELVNCLLFNGYKFAGPKNSPFGLMSCWWKWGN